jgi:hypothetical protein
MADKVKDRLRQIIERGVNRLKGEEFDGEYFVRLSDVVDVIRDSD